MEYDFPCYQPSISHCQKCGRRSRKHHTNTAINNHSHRFECKQQRRFPTAQINDNHSKSNQRNVIIDQFIEVRQLNTANDRTVADGLKRVQQMIYLRENINNLTYREIHFPNEYVIVKRLEEKNHLIHQNRLPVDHYFRPLKLQYQTMSTLCQNIPVTSFTYSKEDTSIVNLLVEDQSTSLSADSPILNRAFQHQNYSQNAALSEAAVIVDVRKCPQVTTHHAPMQIHWNHVLSTWNTSLLKSNQQSHNSNHTSPQQISRVPSETTCSSPKTARNYLSEISASINYTETLHKLKQILNALQKHLLKRSRFNETDSPTMSSDSLATTYSVSSTVPISQIEVDPLNKNYYSDKIQLRNSAKNVNYNQQISDDEDTEDFTESPRRRSMSPTFMFVLQILLVLCLIDRIAVYHFFGTVPPETFLSRNVDDSQKITPISSTAVKETEEIAVSRNNETFFNLFLSFFVSN